MYYLLYKILKCFNHRMYKRVAIKYNLDTIVNTMLIRF
jgi:hypothetical protein